MRGLERRAAVELGEGFVGAAVGHQHEVLHRARLRDRWPRFRRKRGRYGAEVMRRLAVAVIAALVPSLLLVAIPSDRGARDRRPRAAAHAGRRRRRASPRWRRGPGRARCTSPSRTASCGPCATKRRRRRRSSTSGSSVSQDGGERGLLGLDVLPRRHARSTSTTATPTATRRSTSTSMRGDRATPSSRTSILQVEQPQPNHNGGQLAFGPDGYLYLGLGDGGGAGDAGAGHAPGGNGQSLDTLLGKILRIAPDPDRRVGLRTRAARQPVRRRQADARPEIWSYGLRNPWRFSFDSGTGDLWIGDVGQNEYEEIDRVPATNGRDAGKGVNFGWNRLEGDHAYRGSGARRRRSTRLRDPARHRRVRGRRRLRVPRRQDPRSRRHLPLQRQLRRHHPSARRRRHRFHDGGLRPRRRRAWPASARPTTAPSTWCH